MSGPVAEPFSQAQVAAFFAASQQAFGDACAALGERRLALDIAGVRIDLRFAGAGLHDFMAPALAGCTAAADDGPAQVTLLAFDSRSSGTAIPPPPGNLFGLFTWRGEIWTQPDTAVKFVFDQADYTIQLFDPARGLGIFMVDSHQALPYWSKAAPLRSLLGVALEANGVQLVHGAAIGSRDGAVLLTGRGGAGKSSTALAGLARGMGFLGDDYVAVRPPVDAGSPPTVHTLFASAKVAFGELDRFGDLARHAAARQAADQPKAVLLPFAADDSLLVRAAPLVATLTARIGAADRTEIVPCEPERVARTAYASTALQIPYTGDVAQRRIAASIVRPHELRLGRDRDELVGALRAFLRDPVATAPAGPAAPGPRPRVSVVVPVHNGSGFLGEALASIHRQAYPGIEVIVVDDGSTDDIAAVSATIDLPHRLLRQDQAGPAAARNRGIAAASGEMIALLDVDDLWPDGNLARLLAEFAAQPELDVVHGYAESFVADPASGRPRFIPHIRSVFPYYLGAGLYRRSVFDLVGPMDASMMYGEDSDWFLRAYEKARIVMVPETTLFLRSHDANMTRDKSAAGLGVLHIVKRKLDRRRASQDALDAPS